MPDAPPSVNVEADRASLAFLRRSFRCRSPSLAVYLSSIGTRLHFAAWGEPIDA